VTTRYQYIAEIPGREIPLPFHDPFLTTDTIGFWCIVVITHFEKVKALQQQQQQQQQRQ